MTGYKKRLDILRHLTYNGSNILNGRLKKISLVLDDGQLQGLKFQRRALVYLHPRGNESIKGVWHEEMGMGVGSVR